jgi:hypothetical protein
MPDHGLGEPGREGFGAQGDEPSGVEDGDLSCNRREAGSQVVMSSVAFGGGGGDSANAV